LCIIKISDSVLAKTLDSFIICVLLLMMFYTYFYVQLHLYVSEVQFCIDLYDLQKNGELFSTPCEVYFLLLYVCLFFAWRSHGNFSLLQRLQICYGLRTAFCTRLITKDESEWGFTMRSLCRLILLHQEALGTRNPSSTLGSTASVEMKQDKCLWRKPKAHNLHLQNKPHYMHLHR